MLILTIRTDKPEAEIGLFEDDRQLAYSTWLAHRELAETLHLKIREVLKASQKQLKDLDGIVVYKGPGSFTGLRIGISLANALTFSLKIPIVGTTGQNWLEKGQKMILTGQNDQVVIPDYGAEPHITKPKH